MSKLPHHGGRERLVEVFTVGHPLFERHDRGGHEVEERRVPEEQRVAVDSELSINRVAERENAGKGRGKKEKEERMVTKQMRHDGQRAGRGRHKSGAG